MKLPKSVLKVALKALKDVGATTDDIIRARKGGTLEEVFEAASKVKTPPPFENANHRLLTTLRQQAPVGADDPLDILDSAAGNEYGRLAQAVGSENSRALTDVASTIFFRRDPFPYPGALAARRIAQQRPEAFDLLMRSMRNKENLSYNPRSILTANQIARNPAGKQAVGEAIERGAADPIYTARALLREGFSDQQKEIFLSLVQNGYSPDDAAQLAKALA